jgi:hypothetical protein
MGFPEFVVVIASIMALNPLAMDMMLPALPDIASTFQITGANRPQAVLSTFLIGFGPRPVHHGAAVGPVRPPPGAGRRHGVVLHRQCARDHRAIL